MQAYSAVLNRSGKDHQRNMRWVFPVFHVRVVVKHCKRMASLYKHMGDILGAHLQYKGVNQKSKIIIFLIHLILHAYVNIVPPSAAQSSNILFLHPKIKEFCYRS